MLACSVAEIHRSALTTEGSEEYLGGLGITVNIETDAVS
jgi:hypothetical protein